jgi:molybdopterin-guanine dinucleotide biosynthesis protein A
MVQLAVEKLRSFCAEVSIAGNRDDLKIVAPVVWEARSGVGPAAGIEAGLKACVQPWAMFLPVDVPLVPAELLKGWMQAVLAQEQAGCAASYLLVNRERQPTFCAVRRAALPSVTAALERGERRLDATLGSVDEDDRGWLWVCDAAQFAARRFTTGLEMEYWFWNVNTVQELEEAEAWAAASGEEDSF